MPNSTLRVLPSFAWHVAQLLSFQHDGRGLPRNGSPSLMLMVGLKLALTCMVITMMMPEVGVVSGFLKSLMAVAALYACASASRRFYAFSGYLLLWSGVDVGLLVLNLAVDHVPEAFITTCYAWGLSAFIVLLMRAATLHEKNTS
jgi:hypothetical protein